jgi:perosamine synthetase
MGNVDVKQFVDAIRSVVGPGRVGLHEPQIDEIDHRYVRECLDSTFVSSVGPFVNRFEQELAEFTGAKHGIAVSNGTVALQVAMTLAGVRRGDEVIIPALSFIATANAVVHAGGEPYFVDSSDATLGMDPTALEIVLNSMTRDGASLVNPGTGRRIGAIVPMHTFGHPLAIERIVELGEQFGVPVVEDAAESLGSYVGTRHTGTFGALGILSFNGNKIVTTGGGGMILTNNDELAARAKHLTTTAKLPHEWEFEHDEVGFNFRMPNLNAALGVAQFSKINDYLSRKRVLANRYSEAFADVEGIDFLQEPEGTTSNYWLCSVRVPGGLAERNALLRAANDDGIQARPFWNLLSRQRPYSQSARGDLTRAQALEESVISIPSAPRFAG